MRIHPTASSVSLNTWNAMENVLFNNWESISRTLIIGALAYVSLVAMLRISGKRTLSQINEFDFIVTVALGSTLATVLLNKDIALADGMAAMALLIFLQFILASVSLKSKSFRKLISSEPTLVFFKGKFLSGALKKQRLTESDIISILRSQQIGSLSEVDAVVLESNGEFSVVKSGSVSNPDSTLSDLDI
jgi:uncharacterized membrane protein YcaP (DUF421 family)